MAILERGNEDDRKVGGEGGEQQRPRELARRSMEDAKWRMRKERKSRKER